MCLTETKLSVETQLSFGGEGYKMWRRDRKGKGGGGILVLVKEGVKVEDVQYGVGMAEVVSVTTKTSEGRKRRIIVVYVPPKTGAWRKEEHKEMREEVIKCLEGLINKCSTVVHQVSRLTGAKKSA